MNSKDSPLYIITGGVGFIGSCLVRHLNDQGLTNLVLVDDLGQTLKWKNLLGKSFTDVLDKSQLFSWLEGRESEIAGIIHLGACSTTVETDASYLLENNYRYTIKLIEYALKNDIRFIYASSAATYGDGKRGFSDRHEEIETLRPLNMYGMSKQLVDMWVKKEGLLDEVVGLKFFNVFGPNEVHKGRMASVIVHVLPTILKEGKVRLFKSNEPDLYCDGGQKRDFVYIKDVVRMIEAFLTSTCAGGIYNVASGQASTWNELASAIFSAVEKPLNIEYIDMPRDLTGYQNYTCADMQKTWAAIGEVARCTPLKEAVRDYVCNYLLPDEIW